MEPSCGPIQRLTESARDLGEGNLDQVLPVSSHDELGQLANAFNKMAGKLRLYRQATTDELVHARQATEIVFAALLDPIVIFSADGEIAYQNPAAERLRKKLASTDTVLPIVPLAMKVLLGDGDFLPESFDQAICVRVDDREKFLLPRVIGLQDGGSGAVVILNDVTRFRLMDDVKTNLVATVSHELKTPLTSIRMAVYLLLEERIGALNPKQTELLIASRDDAERLLDLINNLLDLARLESGVTTSERRAQNCGDLVRQATNAARELVSVAGLKIMAQIDAGLPPVMVSADQLAHVFSNLISNAAKHSPPGEEITVATRMQTDQRAVRFSVVDHGAGIPSPERERVFEKFYRLPGEPREGAGLGLAICREIVHAHGGEIGVVPGPAGRGSEFFFVLPADSPAHTKPLALMNHGKIFVIDDERTIRFTFRLALETDGYEVQEAASVGEALMGFRSGTFDLAVLDLRIGEESGLDVLTEMRRRGVQTPTLMITAYGSIRNAVRAMQLGAIDFLEKPIEPVALRKVVAEILDRHQPRPVEAGEPAAIGSQSREVKRLINLQDFDAAAACLAAALQTDGESSEIYNLQGVLAEIRGDYDEARRAYGRAIKFDSKHEAAQQNMRRLFELFNFGRSDEPLHYGGKSS